MTARKLVSEKKPEARVTIQANNDEGRTTIVYENAYARKFSNFGETMIFSYDDGPGAKPRVVISHHVVLMYENCGDHGDTFKAPQKPAEPTVQGMTDAETDMLIDQLNSQLEPWQLTPMRPEVEDTKLTASGSYELAPGNYVAEIPIHDLTGTQTGVARIRPAIPPAAVAGDVKKKRELPHRIHPAAVADYTKLMETTSEGRKIADTPTIKVFDTVEDPGEEPAIGSSSNSPFFGNEKVSPPGSGLARTDEGSPSGLRAAWAIFRGPKKEETYEVQQNGTLVKLEAQYRPSGSTLVRKDMGHRGGSWLKQKLRLFTQIVFVPAILGFMLLGASYGPHPER